MYVILFKLAMKDNKIRMLLHIRLYLHGRTLFLEFHGFLKGTM